MPVVHQQQNKILSEIYHGDSFRLNCLQTHQIGDEHCDVTIKIGNSIIKAHKSVIRRAFLFFKLMFRNKLNETISNYVELQGVPEEIFKDFIKLAYTDKLTVNIDNVQLIYSTADYFYDEKLKRFCEEFFVENLEAFNALELRRLGLHFRSSSLVVEAEEFIAKHFEDIVFTENLLALNAVELMDIVSRSDLQVKSEESVFEAVKIWINYDFKERCYHIHDLLEQVRLVNVNYEYLINDVSVFPACCCPQKSLKLLDNALKCQQLVQKALNYHLFPEEPSVLNAIERGYPEGKVLLFAGDELEGSNLSQVINSIDCFDQYGCKEIAKINIARVNFGTATVKGECFVTGGLREDYETYLNDVEVYSVGDNETYSAAPMNVARSTHGCCAHGDQVYVCGGKDELPSTCCEVLKPVEDVWEFVASMDVARRDFQLVSCEDFIWALGGRGYNALSERYEVLNSTEFYDDIINRWIPSASMIEKRCGYGAIAFRKHILIIGGEGSNGESLASAEVLDTVFMQFSAIKSMSIPRQLFAVTIVGKFVYCFGGQNDDQEDALSSIESYNLITNEWKTENNLPRKRSSFRAVTV